MRDKLLFALALVLILAGTVNIDTPWLSNTGSAAWAIRLAFVGIGVVLCLLGFAINRRKRDANSGHERGKQSQS